MIIMTAAEELLAAVFAAAQRTSCCSIPDGYHDVCCIMFEYIRRLKSAAAAGVANKSSQIHPGTCQRLIEDIVASAFTVSIVRTLSLVFARFFLWRLRLCARERLLCRRWIYRLQELVLGPRLEMQGQSDVYKVNAGRLQLHGLQTIVAVVCLE